MLLRGDVYCGMVWCMLCCGVLLDVSSCACVIFLTYTYLPPNSAMSVLLHPLVVQSVLKITPYVARRLQDSSVASRGMRRRSTLTCLTTSSPDSTWPRVRTHPSALTRYGISQSPLKVLVQYTSSFRDSVHKHINCHETQSFSVHLELLESDAPKTVSFWTPVEPVSHVFSCPASRVH